MTVPAVTSLYRALIASPTPCHLSLATVPGWRLSVVLDSNRLTGWKNPPGRMYYVLKLDFGLEPVRGSGRKWIEAAAKICTQPARR